MWTCTICHFATELDDVVARMAGDRCICLRCFDRATDQSKPMPKALRRQLMAAMAEPGVA